MGSSENAVVGAKLHTHPENSCTIEDIEMVFNGVQDVWFVDENGEATELKETSVDGQEFAYYYCNGCHQDWTETAVQSQEEAWDKVKEHLHESN